MPYQWKNLKRNSGSGNTFTLAVTMPLPKDRLLLGDGWFVRSQPQMVFNWKTGKQLMPIDLGVWRV